MRENTRANRATGERDWLPCIQRLGLEMVALHLSVRENANLEAELRWRYARPSSATCEDNLGLQRESPDVSGKPARRFLSWEAVQSPLASGLTDRASCIRPRDGVLLSSWRVGGLLNKSVPEAFSSFFLARSQLYLSTKILVQVGSSYRIFMSCQCGARLISISCLLE